MDSNKQKRNTRSSSKGIPKVQKSAVKHRKKAEEKNQGLNDTETEWISTIEVTEGKEHAKTADREDNDVVVDTTKRNEGTEKSEEKKTIEVTEGKEHVKTADREDNTVVVDTTKRRNEVTEKSEEKKDSKAQDKDKMQEEYTNEIHEVRTKLIKEEKKNKIIEERIGEMIVMNKHLSTEIEELENRQRRKGIETKDNSTQTIIENENKMTYKIIKNNNMIKFENLTDIEIIAIYYITTIRYFDEIPDNFDIKWKSDIDYKKIKKI